VDYSMNLRLCLPAICLAASFAAGTAWAQQQGEAANESESPTGAATLPALPSPQQSPIATVTTAPELVTTASTAADAVAGTCPVIDNLLMDICSQSPKPDYCAP
jgi:hypothetical protein